ncbi:hypothetical protein ACFQL1_23610 [Halomicroarcula sp. GCM10025709]|uniref:hypothetical protein n=1 Tax=Haloarcula TaxID=2237 RepID=UPI0024C42996|nr:hypothetical protein [Halomicroarcula sp. YJ-61-S]
MDIRFPYPPDISQWNNIEMGLYNGMGRNVSVYPNRANTKSNGSIRDAYIEIFRVTPSTVVHHENGTTQYVRPNGSVEAVLNYRVERPAKVVRPKFVTTWRVTDSEVENLDLWVNNSTEDSLAASTHKPTFEFKKINGTSKLTVNGTVNVTLQRKTVFHTNGTVRQRKSTVSQSISDSRVVKTQLLGPSTVYGKVGDHRDSAGASVAVPRMWRSIEFSSTGQRVHSRWFFYTRSPTGWKYWTKSKNPATSIGPSGPTFHKIRPLQVHAIPAEDGAITSVYRDNQGADSSFTGSQGNYTRLTDDFRVSKNTGPDASGATVSSSVNLAGVSEYTRSKRVAIREAGTRLATDYQDIRVTGIVRGSKQTATLSASSVVQVYPVNLTAELANRNKTHTSLKITAISVSGIPQKRGTLVVNSRRAKSRVNLTRAHNIGRASNGRVIVHLAQPHVREVKMRYIPRETWWEQNRHYGSGETAMSETKTIQRIGGGFPAFKHAIELAVAVILMFGPMIAMLYFVDVLTNGRLIGVYSQ